MQTDKKHAAAALKSIKSVIKARDLYLRLYGKEPNRLELQQLVNRLNPERSNPNAQVLGEWLKVLPELQQLTLAEFFKLT